MSISAAAITYSGTGPAQTGQVLVNSLSDPNARSLYGTAVITGDGSTVAAAINFIDGTKTLSFTPTAVFCQRIVAGTDTGAAAMGSACNVSSITNTGFTLNFTGAGSNGNTATFAFLILK